MASGALDDVGGRRDDIQAELDQLSANSDVESELHRLRGEIAASAPKQLEGGPNGDGFHEGQSQAQSAPYAPPAPTQPEATPQQAAQSAGIPVSDLPSANDQPQDGEGS
jgi:hypothetical protein